MMSASFAHAQLDVPRPPAQKPLRPPAESIATRLPQSTPVLALAGRFRLARKGEVTTVSQLVPTLASVQGPGAPLTFRINKAIKPLFTLIRPGNAPSVAHIRIPKVLIKRADLALALEDVEADATLKAGAFIESAFLRGRLLNLPFWTHPIELRGEAALDTDQITFRGTTTSAAGRVVATFNGIARSQEAAGNAQVRLNRLAFALDGLQPQELVSFLGDDLTAVRGTLAASGTARWNGGNWAVGGTVSLEGLSFLFASVGVENLTGTVAFDRIWPPRTPPGQTLRVARIDTGLNANDGTIQFQIDDRGRLGVEHAAISFSGGRLLLEPVTLDPQANHYDIVFRADSLDLQAVLDAANVEAARASGRVSGRIPVRLSGRGVAVHQATLATDEQGVLSYRPATPPAALQQEDGGVKLLRDALENFHYDRLTITLDGDSGNEWNSSIHIAGKNPDLLDGQPFVLNVNLTVVPGQASVELGARTLDVGDTLPVYNALFGLGFLEWLGNSLRAIGTSVPSPDN